MGAPGELLSLTQPIFAGLSPALLLASLPSSSSAQGAPCTLHSIALPCAFPLCALGVHIPSAWKGFSPPLPARASGPGSGAAASVQPACDPAAVGSLLLSPRALCRGGLEHCQRSSRGDVRGPQGDRGVLEGQLSDFYRHIQCPTCWGHPN